MKTSISIQAQGYIDDSLPIYYRFVLYVNADDYQLDVVQGNPPEQRRQIYLSPYTQKNSISAYFPTGELLMLVQIEDNEGAVMNETLVLNVISNTQMFEHLSNIQNVLSDTITNQPVTQQAVQIALLAIEMN